MATATATKGKPKESPPREPQTKAEQEESLDRRSDSLTDFSAHRIGIANKCGRAFQFQYVDKIPAPYEAGALLFGNVIHDGVAEWYGPGPRTDANENRHRELDLIELCNRQWQLLLPPKIWDHLGAMIALDEDCKAMAEAICLKRPEIKAPLQTKDYLESRAAKEMVEAKEEMLRLCDKSNEIRWPKDEDPFKAYKKMQMIAERLQREWRKQPRPLLVEEPFRLEFKNYVIRGRIDQVRHDFDVNTGELKEPEVNDLKSGRNPLTQMEAFWQVFIYWKANTLWEWTPETTQVGFTLVRHVDERGQTKVQRGRIDPKRHERLASRILNGVARKVSTAQFEPAYGYWCKRCDFHSQCETEIDLWAAEGFEINV